MGKVTGRGRTDDLVQLIISQCKEGRSFNAAKERLALKRGCLFACLWLHQLDKATTNTDKANLGWKTKKGNAIINYRPSSDYSLNDSRPNVAEYRFLVEWGPLPGTGTRHGVECLWRWSGSSIGATGAGENEQVAEGWNGRIEWVEEGHRANSKWKRKGKARERVARQSNGSEMLRLQSIDNTNRLGLPNVYGWITIEQIEGGMGRSIN